MTSPIVSPDKPPRTARVRIQPAQTRDVHADYDPRKRLPYPYYVEPDGRIARQDVGRGAPDRLAGFQTSPDVEHVDLLEGHWTDGSLDAAVGMFPVFIDADGSMWTLMVPVKHIEVAPTTSGEADPISDEMKRVAAGIFAESLACESVDAHIVLENAASQIAEQIWPLPDERTRRVRERFLGMCFTKVTIERTPGGAR